MAIIATDLTREHYQRPEVREIICKYAMPGDGVWRALNGDFYNWYMHRKSAAREHEVRLRNMDEDYDVTIEAHRTLYATLNVFNPKLRSVVRLKESITSDDPLGTPADTVAYTLGTDIDKGHGYDIEDPEVKQAVEDAAQFLVDYLKERGIHQSIWVLFSGGGIYIEIHHEICRPKSSTPEDRAAFFEVLTDRYNRLIKHVEAEFFKACPEHASKVKYDALNNSKRVFKCIFSIHKKKPYAVIPLSRDAIKIDFRRATLPIRDDVIAEGRAWYSTYDPAEREPLFRLLDEFKEGDTARQNREFKEIWASAFKIDSKYFPPCIKYILETPNPGEGKTRVSAVLSTFLYQMGWPEDEAWALVEKVSVRNGLSNAEHIFDSSFGRISCPGCYKIQSDATGYPHLGLAGLGICHPEEECDRWPGDYSIAYALGDVQTSEKEKACKVFGPSILDAIKVLVDNESEVLNDKDFKKWEWSRERARIRRAVYVGYLSKKDEDELHKFLKIYENILRKYGIEYGDLWAIPRPEKPTREEFDWRVKAAAWNVLKRGDPIEYIADACGRTVLGAEAAFKKLTCCISVQNIKQSSGLHPKLSGESSGGKTYTIYTFAHHLPFEAVVKGSMSNKSGFYHRDGARVLRIQDDYLAGNEDMDTVIKQTSSEFHEPYTHRTVANHAAVTLQIESEQTWAITSVDSSQDIQVLNRQLPINVNDSRELTKEVNDKTVQRYGEGGAQKPVDKNVLVCRTIFQILRDQPLINVRVPFWDRIEWIDTSNRRNPSIFMDLLIAHTAMYRYQREQDEDGFYLATEADFKAAKELFTDKDAEELVKRLTTRERDVINLLISNSDGLTRDEIASKLYPPVAPDRVTQILRGRNGSGGLFQKVQIAETKISDTIAIDDTQKRTVHKAIYSLKEYDRFLGFDGVVKLKSLSEEPTNQAKHELCNELCNQNDIGLDDLSKLSKKEKEREIEKRDGLGDELGTSSRENEENAKLHSSKVLDADKACIADGKPCLACIAHSSDSGSKIKVEAQAASELRAQKEAHAMVPNAKSSKHAQSPTFLKFKGILDTYKDKGPFITEEFLKQCDQSGIVRHQAKGWIQASREAGKLREAGPGMLEVMT